MSINIRSENSQEKASSNLLLTAVIILAAFSLSFLKLITYIHSILRLNSYQVCFMPFNFISKIFHNDVSIGCRNKSLVVF